MSQVQKRVLSFVKDTKPNCDETGTCYGFTDPCVQEPFKHFSNPIPYSARHGRVLRTATAPVHRHCGPVLHGHENAGEAPVSPGFRASRTPSREPLSPPDEETEVEDADEAEDECQDDSNSTAMPEWDAESQQHHHHVPANAFLSIGLQTSIAIALHKFPEGFITYATNHANPTLGFNVFMALFVHNISEGFAMCLPLYMALGSRWRAIFWSALLGGLSQPLGAGVAVLWFKLARRTNMSPNSVVYACLFAITAGIMVSVALQLFVEALSLNHNRNLCIGFGFLGMAILGLSNALFGGH
jgi:ZIP family zinc transporter